MNGPRETEAGADHVVLSYQRDDKETADERTVTSKWIEAQLETSSFTIYLKRVHGGPITVGDEWEEFVNCGCASPMDVLLKVEEVREGNRLGSGTEIEFRSAE